MGIDTRPKLLTGFLLWFVAVTIAHEAPEQVLESEQSGGEDGDNKKIEVLYQNVLDAEKLLADWFKSDHIEVYYGEFLLAQWVLDKAPWNAYHSGLGFVDNRTGKHCLYEYTPVDTSSVMNMLVPNIEGTEDGLMMFGKYNMVFKDEAKTQLRLYWPKSYEKFTRLGVIKGSTFQEYSEWVTQQFAPQHTAFQPLELVHLDKQVEHWGSVHVRSNMCHDFVTDSLWHMHKSGASFRAESQVFRDHIIMYAQDIRNVTVFAETWLGKRKWLRYLRQLYLSIHLIRKEFTYAREALLWNWQLHLPAYLHTQRADFQVTLAPPFLNYCYLPLALPPNVHDPMGEVKLCALGLTANTTNSTAPWPWGTLLSVEERLDRIEVLTAWLLVASIAAMVASSSSSV
eukprot:TRINITY_DN17244_c0_g1_i1.p1 TRINITY_DN17244_c0_g1~~TRINITY_DN17244_c0_g1_i1.p1  ORF type:complete len:405 (-),score=57.29 TRINITY_DN17244_c0_g1_i1:28-1221(-)